MTSYEINYHEMQSSMMTQYLGGALKLLAYSQLFEKQFKKAFPFPLATKKRNKINQRNERSLQYKFRSLMKKKMKKTQRN